MTASISRSSTGKLLYDPFDGAVTDNWAVVQGTVAIEAGELSVAASGGLVGAGVKSKATYSGTLAYGGRVTVAAGYALVYWHLSGSNYYRFLIPSGASVTATLIRFDAGVPTTLDSEAGVACVVGATYAWKILHNTVTGAIAVYWGGTLILSATDTTYTSGLVYLYSSAATINTAHVHYDNVYVATANTITVSGLPTGWDIICGGVTAHESGGVATLDMAGVALPQSSLDVRDASDVVKVTFTSASDVWGGDVLPVTVSAAYSAQALRRVATAATFSAQTKRVVRAAAAYASQSRRIVLSAAAYAGQAVRKVTSPATYQAQAERVVAALAGRSAQTERRITALAGYAGQAWRGVRAGASLGAQALRRVVRGAGYEAQTNREVKAGASLGAQTSRQVQAAAWCGAQTRRTLDALADHAGQTARVVVTAASCVAQTLRGLSIGSDATSGEISSDARPRSIPGDSRTRGVPGGSRTRPIPSDSRTVYIRND